MENRIRTETYIHTPVSQQGEDNVATYSGPFASIKKYGTKLANNIDPLNLYARLKDYYKGIEIAAPWIADWITRGKTHRDNPAWKENKDIMSNAGDTIRNTMQDPNWEHSEDKKRTVFSALADFASGYSSNKEIRNKNSAAAKITELNTGVAGDTVFFGVMRTLSWFSGWAEKSQVQRVYGKLAEIEFGKSESEITYKDLKKSKNPMLRDAAEYYGKKSFIRSVTDFAGLARWAPLATYKVQDKLKMSDDKKLINNTDKGLGKALNGLANFGDGIKLLMFAKTIFFQWYFSSRQTGSFYESKEIWNITEGVSTAPNRALNENRTTGEFVTRQQIATLYKHFREENPNMGLASFTPDDPLSSRLFEQTARYLNHTYMPKLFAISEPGKQKDLPHKVLTHAMLTEFVGSGGLRVEDAIGSAIRLEVMAYHGKYGVEAGIEKFREVSKIISKIPPPDRSKYKLQDELIEDVRSYFSQIDSIGREYLGEFWPPKYINEEIKNGFISTVFEGTELSKEKADYIASALFIRDNNKVKTQDLPEKTEAKEKTKARSFTDKISSRTLEDTISKSTEVSITR